MKTSAYLEQTLTLPRITSSKIVHLDCSKMMGKTLLLISASNYHGSKKTLLKVTFWKMDECMVRVLKANFLLVQSSFQNHSCCDIVLIFVRN